MEQLVSDLRADRSGKQYQGGSATHMELVKLPRFALLSDVNDYATMALQCGLRPTRDWAISCHA
jgi:hypothetical protein